MGGGMRQAGSLAAAGLHTLDHHVARLAQDHTHAKQLGDTLAAHPDVASVDPVETNIVIFSLKGNQADEAVQALAAVGIGCFAFGPDKVRLVTHLDMTSDDVHEACRRMTQAQLIGPKV
jgi:threonine aldolase